MQPLPIGIVGGAGPRAGALLLERVLTLAARLYGCHKDGDYPQIILLSFPFSDMLTLERDESVVKRELAMCLELLRQNGAAILAIACNTLHIFLEGDEKDLVHLPKEAGREISGDKPLVLCSSTSAQAALHRQFFPCIYPSNEDQKRVDAIIDMTLAGIDVGRDLENLVERQKEKTVLLGCTELSLYADMLRLVDKQIIDSVEIAAIEILKNSFLRR